MKETRGKKLLSWLLVFSLIISLIAVNGAVYASAAKKVKLNVTKTKTLKVGKSFKLKVKNLPKTAKKVKYKWKSSKKKVATVSKKGKVKAKKAGITKITCKVTYNIKKNNKTVKQKKKLTCKIKVKAATIVTPTPSPTPTATPTKTPTPTPKPTTETDSEDEYDVILPDYVKEMGIGINLGNTFDAFWEDKANRTTGAQTIGDNKPQNYETCWGAVETTREAIDGMKAAGFSTVRIPVYWGNMMEDDGTFTINEEYIKRVEEVVGWCIDDGMYAVINIHHYDEFLIKNYPREEVIAAIENLWTQIATHFQDYSDHLIFEGFNENVGTYREEDDVKNGGIYTERGTEIYNYINELNQTFVDTVRNTGGNNAERILIISGYWTNIDYTTNEKFLMPEDSAEDRIMVSVHYIDNNMYWSKQIGNQRWIDYSRAQCKLLKNAFTSKGIPVFVGECTAMYVSKYKDNEGNEQVDNRIAGNAIYKTSSECLGKLLNMATNYGFVPVLWDTNDNAYSRTQCRMKSETDQAVITEIAEKIKNRK